MVVDPTPNQSVARLKTCAGLSGSFEFAALWTGQSNSRPWGYSFDFFDFAPELDLESTGQDLTGIVIPDISPSTRFVGMIETLTIGTVLIPTEWNTNTFLRIGAGPSGSGTVAPVPKLGYAKVLSSGSTTLVVQWLSIPTSTGSPFSGYLVRETGKWASYEQLRVLTPWLPSADIQPPADDPTAVGLWGTPVHVPYPTPNARLATGRRLSLPPPYTLPTAVTTFDDLALFLPISKREGLDGFGFSEIADSYYDASPAPKGHPIIGIASTTVTVLTNAMTFAEIDMTGGYLVLDWESGGSSKRSWARIASGLTNRVAGPPDRVDFVVDSWLGDAAPVTPPSATITINTALDEITWTSHGRVVGDRIVITAATTLPTGVPEGYVFHVVKVIDVDKFQVAVRPGGKVFNFVDSGVGALTAYHVWRYTAWIAHWRDNPYMWIPGPEFGYSNEDQQPYQPIHNRPRGVPAYKSTNAGNAFLPFDGVSDTPYGAMLAFAYRVSAAIGKRINMIALGFNSASLAPAPLPNNFAYPGILGWWNYDMFSFALSLEDSDSALSKRLKRLITFIGPQALLAEANSKTLRFLSACHIQGESDSLRDGGRELYLATITDYKTWLRELVASMSPFANGAEMPFAQPMLTMDPWEIDAPGGTYQGGGADVNGVLNNAIRGAHHPDEFGAFTLTEDIPKLRYAGGDVDNAHFSGEGMAVQGARLAAVILDNLDHALSFGSAALSTNTKLLRIVNLALRMIGETAHQISNLDEDSEPARQVRACLPEARKQLLAMRQWSFAMRFEPAAEDTQHVNSTWARAYYFPGRAISVFEVVSPLLPEETVPASLNLQLEAQVEAATIASRGRNEFVIERSPLGHKVILTNVEPIPGDVSEREVADGKLHPERLPHMPLLRYVEHVVDPDRYTDQFATALTWMLASMLAPSMIRGDQGEAVAARCLQKVSGYLRTATTGEGVQRHTQQSHIPDWLARR